MLAHDAYGREGSPRIVLLHGWPLDRTIWSEVAPPLADAGFRVLCPDLPGFGGSPPLPEPRWTIEAFALEVAGFVRGTGSDSVALAGHSFGGYVALALADADREDLAGLGLVASRTSADSDATRAGRQATIAKVRARGTESLLPDLAAKLLAPGASLDLERRAEQRIRACPPRAVVAGLTAMAARPDRGVVLDAFPRPRLVLHGAADQTIPVAEVARPSSAAGTIHRRVLEGVGHLPMWESVQETTQALARWADTAFLG